MSDLYLRYKAISVFNKTARAVEPLVSLALSGDDAARVGFAAEVFSAVAESGCASTGEWIKRLIETDDNIFSRTAASGGRVSPRLKACVENELLTFKQLSLVNPEDYASDLTFAFFPMFGFGGMNTNYDKLLRFYAANGCGDFARGNTFVYRGVKREREKSGERKGVKSDIVLAEQPAVSLSDLKNYEEEKAEIVKNTENFINGLPAFHTLLYGDRGTGKSTTVRAVAHDYRDKLKVVELPKNDLEYLPDLLGDIAGLKQHYIIFVDDLSFDEDDGKADAFKSALEGSLSSAEPGGNALIYCTSNRRHLYKESDAPKMLNDDRQAELALFDRFGLVITYVNPDKNEFIDIFKQILRSRGVKWRDEYASIAELAALKKGGRSPRAAKQIADLIEAAHFEASNG